MVWQCIKRQSPHTLNDLLITHHTPTLLTWWQHALTWKYRWEYTEFSPSLCLYFFPRLKCRLYYTHAHTPTCTAHWDKVLTSEGGFNYSFFLSKSEAYLPSIRGPECTESDFCLHSAASSQQTIIVPEGQLLLNASLLLHHEPRSWMLHVLKAKVKIYNSFAPSDSSASLFILLNKW